MTAEKKLYALALANTTLQADLGTNPFRWFDRQLKQGVFGAGKTCVRVLRVSTGPSYNQGGNSPLNTIRFQIDVLDTIAETARSVAADIQAFMATVDLASGQQFASPPTTPGQFPCFLLNQRADMDAQLQPAAYVEIMDWRIYNREDI
jgi:hypothetical protein